LEKRVYFVEVGHPYSVEEMESSQALTTIVYFVEVDSLCPLEKLKERQEKSSVAENS